MSATTPKKVTATQIGAIPKVVNRNIQGDPRANVMQFPKSELMKMFNGQGGNIVSPSGEPTNPSTD